MTSVILPSEASGVSIYDTPGDLPAASSVPSGTVASVVSDGTIRQAQGAVWEVVGSTTVIVGISDTPSINLTLTADVLSGDVILSPDAASAGSQLVALNAQANGLRAQIANALIRGLFSILDTNSIDLGYNSTTGEFTALLKLSAAAADANNFLASLSIQTDGLRAQIPNSSIRGLFSVLDSTSINFSYNSSTGVFTGEVIFSGSGADGGFIQTQVGDDGTGVRAQTSISLIRNLFGVTDTNAIDMGYNATTGVFTATLNLSAVVADANNFLANTSLQGDGLRVQVPFASVRALFSATDTNSIDFTYNSGTGDLSGSVKLSAAAADANNQLVSVSIQTDGIRAQIANSVIRALFSILDTNSIDLGYNSTTGEFTASLKISAAAADVNNFLASSSIQSDGLRVQIANASIRALFSILDTSSIDLGYNSGTGEFTGSLKLSAVAASANNFLVSLNIETDGLRGQIANATIRGLFSALAPLAFNSTTGEFTSIAATEALSGHVTTAAQNFGGDKAFVGNIVKVNNATNASAVSDVIARDAFAQPTNLQSAVFTFLKNTGLNTSPYFELYAGNNMAVISAPYGSTEINWLSDPGNIALLTDAGTGFFISKSANSSALTVKNRSGGTLSVGVLPVHGTVTATAWA